METQIVIFNSAEETLGLDISEVTEIINLTEITRIPLTPDYFMGLMNLRGGILPVIDLNMILGKGRSERTARSRIIIVERRFDEAQKIGVFVDDVKEILAVADQDLEQRPDFGLSVPEEMIRSILKKDGTFILILQLDRILTEERMFQFRLSQ